MEKFDVVVVGGGLSGLACAYTLAQRGLEVLVLERGEYSGAKNITGGRLYLNPVREMFGELWKSAPLERFIAHEELSIVDEERSLTFRYSGKEFSQAPYQSYSILRSKFDRWLAKQSEKQGAMLVNKTRVDDVIIENGWIKGVRAGGDELRADVTVICDGVVSLTAEKAGLRKPGNPKHYAVGVKEVIELDREVIQQRFNLEGDEGAARLFIGSVTKGKFGGGFLYTNKDSISLGLVVGIKDLAEGTENALLPEIYEDFKQVPQVASLIKGGNLAEYSAHLIPEGGYENLSQLYGNGVLVAGDAAGFSMNIGFTVRGMEYALASGYYAAQAVFKAKAAGDFSRRGLSVYQEILDASFVMKDFRTFEEAPKVLENQRLFHYYPNLITGIISDVYEVPAGPKKGMFQTVKGHLGFKDATAIIKDIWGGRKI